MTFFYLYQLQSSEELEQVSTDEERQSFNEKLDEVSEQTHNACSHLALTWIFWLEQLVLPQVQEWLYTDGEDATATEFQEHLDMLKDVGGPMFFRYVICLIIDCSFNEGILELNSVWECLLLILTNLEKAWCDAWTDELLV